jgi:uncharacterized protein
MNANLLHGLCTQCGLCCDGSLFADVELAKSEAAALEVLGLEVEDAEDDVRELLLQPCGALKRKRCSIYFHRPECCRTFECRLLQQVKRGEISIDRAKEVVTKALSQIGAVKVLIGQIAGKEDNQQLPLAERVAEALVVSENFSGNSKFEQKRQDLRRAMTSAEKWIQKMFLTS